MRYHHLIASAGMLLIIGSVGCLPAAPTIRGAAGEAAATATEALVNTAEALPALVEEETSTPTAIPTASLPEIDLTAPITGEGPWLVVFTDTGIWIANANGSGATRRVADVSIMNAANAASAIAPGGGRVAYMSATGENYENLALHMIALPSTQDVEVTSLFNRGNQPRPNSSPGDNSIEVARAITEFNSLAWSPDGKALAFVGGVKGPTADLYLYSTEDGSITQLTDGPTQGFQPVFSPDGKWIVHTSALGFGTGAGHAMDTTWAAAADGSEVKRLYTPQSADEVILGFIDDQRFVVESWDPACGSHALRVVSIDSGESSPLTGYFNDRGAAISTATGTALVTIGKYATDCNGNKGGGTFLINLNDGSSQQVLDAEVFDPVWIAQSKAYFARTEDGAIEISPEGKISKLNAPTPTTPVVSPDGTMWAWVGDGYNGPTGIWIGPAGGKARPISDFGSNAIWSPDGKYLFYADEGKLYRVDIATGAAQETGADLGVYGALSMGWAK